MFIQLCMLFKASFINSSVGITPGSTIHNGCCEPTNQSNKRYDSPDLS